MTGLEVLPRNNLRRNLALQYQAETEEKQYHKFAQRFMRTMGPTSGDPEKKYGIKRHRNLGATVFEGSRDPADSESWLVMIEKCFNVLKCPEFVAPCRSS
uniref:Uncharacterized protein n=1 Tax=Cucumis melo TaxID=3656 RepID=A0A9I9CFU6_CUCME